MIIVLKGPVFKHLADDLAGLGVVSVSKKNRYGNDSDKKTYVVALDDSRHSFEGYTDDLSIDLAALTREECEELAKLLDAAKVHGSRVAAVDVRKYLRAADDGVLSVRARTGRQMVWMLEQFLAGLPHHLLFSDDEYGGNSHSGYYAEDVHHYPEVKPDRTGRDRRPEMVVLDLWWIEDDTRRSSTIEFYAAEFQEATVLEMLACAGLVPETPKLVEKLRAETERYYEVREKVGKQFVATGLGLQDLDDALRRKKDDDGESTWRRWGERKLRLDRFGGSARVVIDLLHEKDTKEESGRRGSEGINPYRWHDWNLRFFSPSQDELIRHLDADEDSAERPAVEVPVHPLVPCFDLGRHTRLRVHVNNLTQYQYDKAVGSRLVLPERDWAMVNLLVDHSANKFEDIVGNKGRSMNILAVGSPGTGKTATAEVFAEFKGRPLYSVQCSDLGMSPSAVEHNLGVVMRRANRWKAILLLDEADVYIRKRGADLEQNAIVGAFLRVLEYADCILFMTTNLSDQVDDAITSRCIAKLAYGPPGPEDQMRIWRILADLNKLKFPDAEIAKVAKKHPKLTGRDCKNLLKLASFIAKGKPLTAASVEEALVFKPTETAE